MKTLDSLVEMVDLEAVGGRGEVASLLLLISSTGISRFDGSGIEGSASSGEDGLNWRFGISRARPSATSGEFVAGACFGNTGWNGPAAGAAPMEFATGWVGSAPGEAINGWSSDSAERQS